MKTHLMESHWADKRKELAIEVGWGNGYVLIPQGHPLHGVEYDNINVDVHGGLTFSRLVTGDLMEAFGLELSDLGDWMVGFDTAHYQDSLEKWPKEAVQAETERLRDQLINYNGTND
jgi:hypothetical protein